MKTSTLFLLALLAFPAWAQTNIALNKPTVASSSHGKGLEAYRITDGNIKSKWVSSSTEGDKASIYVDLGSVTSINRVVLRWSPEFAKAYSIRVSNDARSWRVVSTVTNGNGGEDSLTINEAARYVQFFGAGRNLPKYKVYGLMEFEVYGGGTSTPPASSAKSSAAKSSTPTTTRPDEKEPIVSVDVSPDSVVSGFTLSWNIPTERENGEKLKPEELGGYEIRGKNNKGEIVYTKIIEKGTQTSYTEDIDPALGIVVFEISAYDVNGLFSEFVPIKPTIAGTNNDLPKPVNLRIRIE